jgi:sirohydrochlorin ferrochelatase
VHAGYLDHGSPLLSDLDMPGSVVVPLLLSGGFHVHHDIPAAAPQARVTPPLGPDPRLAAVMADRLREAGWDEAAAVVLAAAGSDDPRAIADVHTAAEQLREELGVDVTVGFIAGGRPRVADGESTAIASYLLAPGHFADELARMPVPVVSAPIGADPTVAEVILDRYDQVVSGLG